MSNEREMSNEKAHTKAVEASSGLGFVTFGVHVAYPLTPERVDGSEVWKRTDTLTPDDCWAIWLHRYARSWREADSFRRYTQARYDIDLDDPPF